MAIPVFFLETAMEFWPPLLKRLAGHGLVACYLTTSSAWEQTLAAACPGAIVQNSADAVRGRLAPGLANLELPALDRELLDALAPWQHVVLKMMDRMDPGGAFSYQERVEHYHRYLRYWSAALDRLRPGLIVYAETPHMGYDYVLMRLARLRGIPTLMIDRTSLPGLIFLQEDPEEGWRELAAYYPACLEAADGASLALSAPAQAYLDGLRQRYDQAMPVYIKGFLERARRDQAAGSIKSLAKWCLTPALWLESCRQAWDFLTAPAPDNYIKRRGLPLTAPGMSGLEWRLRLKRRKRGKRALARAYDRLAQPVSLDEPFIFVALHYQPEKTTSPLGGYFADQQLMLDMLLAHLPPGWLLYIKEAPGQFVPYLRGENAKTPQFYASLASHPRMRLLPMSYQSFELIDRARAVATVTGTAGWEAVARGKPAFIFGQAWYRGCEGVFLTETHAQLARAMELAAQGWRPDPERVRRFVHALEVCGIRGYHDRNNQLNAGISQEENLAALEKALLARARERGVI